MKKILTAAVVTTFMLTSATLNQARAVVLLPPAPLPGAGAGAGAAGAGGFIGFVGFLALYDFVRRTSCVGDFLHLGGPGFSEPIKPGQNVLTPQCKPIKKARKPIKKRSKKAKKPVIVRVKG